jgi:hypothetical protein
LRPLEYLAKWRKEAEMACPALDTLFNWAAQQENPSAGAGFTVMRYDIITQTVGQGKGEGTLQYFPGRLVKVGDFWIPIPPTFSGTVSYDPGTGDPPFEPLTLQISSTPPFLVPLEGETYTVTLAPETPIQGDILSGSFTPVWCQPVLSGQGGVIMGSIGINAITMTLTAVPG